MIDWARPVIVKLCVTSEAGRNELFPACEATRTQVPRESGLTVPEDKAQILGVVVARETLNPELEVALTL